MALEGADHRLVGLVEDLLEDPAEVAHRLVVVDDERERDPRRHGVQRAGFGARAGRRDRRSATGTPAAGR